MLYYTRPAEFSDSLLRWYESAGRHDLPWQLDRSPYRIWVSEIMLQQTQVKTVIPYFHRFMSRFPDVEQLADAPLDEVMHLWTGLGYYARARNLYKTAQIIAEKYRGEFPDNIDELMGLPGIGRSTAGAILAMAFHQSQPIADGNVKRVLARVHAVAETPTSSAFVKKIWKLAEQYTPEENVAAYTQAIMDLGATVCLRNKPLCAQCPVAKLCQANLQNRVFDYPSKRKKLNRPTKSTIFAILQSKQGEILLEQRPPNGVWGGLWSFPEYSGANDKLDQWITEHLGMTVTDIHYGEQLQHAFSHFDLKITPAYARVTGKCDRVGENLRYRWLLPSSNFRLGLAQPVKRLLNNLNTEQSQQENRS